MRPVDVERSGLELPDGALAEMRGSLHGLHACTDLENLSLELFIALMRIAQPKRSLKMMKYIRTSDEGPPAASSQSLQLKSASHSHFRAPRRANTSFIHRLI